VELGERGKYLGFVVLADVAGRYVVQFSAAFDDDEPGGLCIAWGRSSAPACANLFTVPNFNDSSCTILAHQKELTDTYEPGTNTMIQTLASTV
jgi:hypothetical protein